MKKLILFFSFFSGIVSSINAAPLMLSAETKTPVGQYASFLKETHSRLSLNAAKIAYAQNLFSPSADDVMTFGIGSNPVWIRFDVNNDTGSASERYLSIETSWLDNIELFFISENGNVISHSTGDAYPFNTRESSNRYFILGHLFETGTTAVYIRTETADPMVLPVYLSAQTALHNRGISQSYGYGIVYGVMLTLIVYNLMLYAGLKARRYLAYSVYLSFFLLMNLSYTGHAYNWLWPASPELQIWGNPVLMITYGISGLLFASSFLDTRLFFPRMHKTTIAICIVFATAISLTVLIHNHVAALLIAFSFVLLFTITMVVLGSLAFYAGNQSAKYFLYGSLIAALGATITALTVWGITPFNTYTYRAVEIGTVFEAILLALALSDRLRHTQQDKLAAEMLARIDPLTCLNNRRAFSDLTAPMWNNCIRKNLDASLVLLDIDTFKNINDTFGHAQGDNVLIHTAEALKQTARAGDVLARWGGEEFILFMPDTKLTDAVTVAKRMCEKISSIEFEINGEKVSFTASFGVAISSTEINTLDKLISAADNYLYLAKKQGRNRVCSSLDNITDNCVNTTQVLEV